jgi:hypothetical protein
MLKATSTLVLAMAAMTPLLPASASAQGEPAAATNTDILRQRADDLVAIANGGGDVPATFTGGFLAQVPETQVRALFGQMAQQMGQATGIVSIDEKAAGKAAVILGFERGTASLAMGLDGTADAKIAELLITGVKADTVMEMATLDDVRAAFEALPGVTGFAVADPDGARLISQAIDADATRAVGSAFKLVILGELTRQIAAGERSWDDEIALPDKELPGGQLTAQMPGTKVSLRKLAELMISISDNSATDVLLETLGRENVEAMQEPMGVADPAANIPFLSTMEMFKLKGAGAALGQRYVPLPEKDRRALLAGDVAKMPSLAVGPLFADGKPVMVDKIEWFFSPMDMVRIMDWFRRQRDTPAGQEALRILAINAGPVAGIRDRFAYAGYKGGSEPGVLNMTLLLQAKFGEWRVVTASWNDTQANGVDAMQFSQLMSRAAELAFEGGNAE